MRYIQSVSTVIFPKFCPQKRHTVKCFLGWITNHFGLFGLRKAKHYPRMNVQN